MILNRFKIPKLLSRSTLPLARSSLLKPHKYFSTGPDSPAPSSSNTIPEVISKRQFLTNLYGV